ncbi:probable salivary secreted peptide [Hyposmocoma kahamanoa]|uniref:probable salivary secreted peptide n=1 Tax=Hyposmocoma kahamanoa TaxID=1477025 RepID=UPI000E6D87C9|nr:probable salivary secreted peptide [Hyposmocoma kahamanoa]
MKTAPILLIVLLSIICLSECKDLIVGTTYNNRLLWQQKVEYNAIPLKKRVKEVFYSDPGQQIFKAIIARDIDHTDAIATVTAGGVGFSYVNIRLKSERGSGLNYQIEIYS